MNLHRINLLLILARDKTFNFCLAAADLDQLGLNNLFTLNTFRKKVNIEAMKNISHTLFRF
jgi:hypothetical protein